LITNIKKMNIKDEYLNLILKTPEHYAAVFLLINSKGYVDVSASAFQFQLERKYKTAKQSIVIADYLRAKGYKDCEIFES